MSLSAAATATDSCAAFPASARSPGSAEKGEGEGVGRGGGERTCGHRDSSCRHYVAVGVTLSRVFLRPCHLFIRWNRGWRRFRVPPLSFPPWLLETWVFSYQGHDLQVLHTDKSCNFDLAWRFLSPMRHVEGATSEFLSGDNEVNLWQLR